MGHGDLINILHVLLYCGNTSHYECHSSSGSDSGSGSGSGSSSSSELYLEQSIQGYKNT